MNKVGYVEYNYNGNLFVEFGAESRIQKMVEGLKDQVVQVNIVARNSKEHDELSRHYNMRGVLKPLK